MSDKSIKMADGVGQLWVLEAKMFRLDSVHCVDGCLNFYIIIKMLSFFLGFIFFKIISLELKTRINITLILFSMTAREFSRIKF